MHLKVYVKLKKKPKNPLVWAKKTTKKTKKPKKTTKKQKKPTRLGFLKKTGFFPTLIKPSLTLPDSPC
jgi:hypothetical protein